MKLHDIACVGPDITTNNSVSHYLLDVEGRLLQQEALRLDGADVCTDDKQGVQRVEDIVREALVQGR